MFVLYSLVEIGWAEWNVVSLRCSLVKMASTQTYVKFLSPRVIWVHLWVRQLYLSHKLGIYYRSTWWEERGKTTNLGLWLDPLWQPWSWWALVHFSLNQIKHTGSHISIGSLRRFCSFLLPSGFSATDLWTTVMDLKKFSLETNKKCDITWIYASKIDMQKPLDGGITRVNNGHLARGLGSHSVRNVFTMMTFESDICFAYLSKLSMKELKWWIWSRIFI